MRRSDLRAGFALLSAIFLLLLMAALGAFMVSFTSTQNASSALDMESSRAYWAAQAGLDWGLYQVLDPLNATVVAPGSGSWPNLPACAAGAPAFAGVLAEFAVSVTCASSDYTEGVKSVRVYRLTSKASKGGVAGNPHFVEREVVATVRKCRALDGAAPTFECP